MKKLLLSSVAFIALPGLSSAADVAMMRGVPAAPAWSWTGFYLGANAGVSYLTSTVDYSNAAGFDGEHPGQTPMTSKVGGVFGFQGGYNWQLNKMVLGLEAEYSWLTGLGTALNTGYLDATKGSLFNSGATAFWSFRGRVGVDVMDGTLLYLTAGGGGVKLQNNWNALATSGGIPKGGSFIANVWKPAFVGGGGIDQKITDRWSVRAEMLWIKPETSSAAPTDVHYYKSTALAPVGPVNYNSDLLVGRIAVNYKIW